MILMIEHLPIAKVLIQFKVNLHLLSTSSVLCYFMSDDECLHMSFFRWYWIIWIILFLRTFCNVYVLNALRRSFHLHNRHIPQCSNIYYIYYIYYYLLLHLLHLAIAPLCSLLTDEFLTAFEKYVVAIWLSV